MALPAENISQAFFQLPFADASDEHLQQLISNAPYCGAAHFLLAKKMFEKKQEGFEQALQKAALHFSNPLLLHYNLNVQPAGFSHGETHLLQAKEEPGKTPTNYETSKTEAEGYDDTIEDEDFKEEEEPVSELAEDAILSNKLSSILKEQAAEFEKPVEQETVIPVEITPHHRIDYFESQGIKLEESNNDKLGSRLRSFTDWLKQMKSINPNPIELKPDAAGERQVENIAQHSNENKEIVTETMAEVLIKQGKPEQAINIYEKLSFIYPSKTAYFAAKIEELKVK